jgi:hypothetical protein
MADAVAMATGTTASGRGSVFSWASWVAMGGDGRGGADGGTPARARWAGDAVGAAVVTVGASAGGSVAAGVSGFSARSVTAGALAQPAATTTRAASASRVRTFRRAGLAVD